MQKRRRTKAVPKDIFGNAPKPITSKKVVVKQPPSSKPPPTPVPVPAVETKEEEEPPVIEEELSESAEEIIQSPEEDVIQSQMLGVTRRKSIGLQPKQEEEEEDSPANGLSDKAQELIDESKLRAKNDQQPKKAVIKTVKIPSIQREAPTPKPPAPKYRRRRNSFQPAARDKRLDRSRHMEYKYEVRGLMADIDVEEEHRSNVLGTMWAKGERQNVAEAKEFLESKHSEGVLTEEQFKKLCDVINKYTVRR
ncbi:MAG TPA: hypothetical protein EYQ15_01660 [Candidatus Poseidoniales archaeon]|nr:MAG: hypothetical protein CXT65_01830 [Euryarchaeota archaeon]HIG38006.1 hypothetical protein [Candidatus Poseidoniales archaeon]